MNYEEYKRKFFVNPQPEPKFDFSGILGTALYYQEYQAALDFYTDVLGPPAYIEGEFTHSWILGETWLTLFPSKDGNPRNIEVPFWVGTPEEVDRLYKAFIAAGAKGDPPIDTLMGEPVRMCVLKDPFGVNLSVVANREINS